MQIVRINGGSAKRYSADIVGAKAANLARMAALGLPVPPAFVLPIELCAAIVSGDPAATQDLADGLMEGIEFLENATGKVLGDRRRPLLVSVRAGAARSMPGMLDTVLNVGCTQAAVRGLLRMTGDLRFANDCRRRFLESYGGVVLGVGPAAFAVRRNQLLAAEGVENEQGLDCEAIERLAASYQHVIEAEDDVLAENPMDQLRAAAEAVHRSWMSERARTYRKLQHLEDLRGTAVTVQAMVFGNAGAGSGAGVAFSRDPSTGAAEPVIDVLFGSQGEDVVSGRYNPDTEAALARSLPAVAEQLREALTRLEVEFGDMQDVEFTIENGKLWFLQTRSAKRTPQAAVRFAIDFVKEGRMTRAEALRRLNGVDFRLLASKRLVDAGEAVARGVSASSGIAVGRAAFDRESAGRLATSGDPIILVRPDINTSDVAGFAVSAGIVTAVGGRTAHAALVARQMGRPCVVGCKDLVVDVAHRSARLAGTAINEGDWLSVDGGAGTIYLGRGAVVVERPDAELAEIERWRMEMPALS
ncbi:MAG TPA: PEP/pyruvate-binding domain-containing protein [Xanthobacteraceae bacterium]|nr:PEP/pyruvate-binding domain-containing protein [Xanthobacteraceae bacterium]